MSKNFLNKHVRTKIKTYFVCKECGDMYDKEPTRCELCGGKKFQVLKMEEDYE